MSTREIITKLQAAKFTAHHRHPDCELCQYEKEGFIMGLDKAIEILREVELAE